MNDYHRPTRKDFTTAFRVLTYVSDVSNKMNALNADQFERIAQRLDDLAPFLAQPSPHQEHPDRTRSQQRRKGDRR